MGAGRSESWPFALGSLMNVNGMFAGREVVEIELDLYASLSIGRERGIANTLALAILQRDHLGLGFLFALVFIFSHCSGEGQQHQAGQAGPFPERKSFCRLISQVVFHGASPCRTHGDAGNLIACIVHGTWFSNMGVA